VLYRYRTGIPWRDSRSASVNEDRNVPHRIGLEAQVRVHPLRRATGNCHCKKQQGEDRREAELRR
jgi:hypothetical protein